MSLVGKNIDFAKKLLEEGKLVAIPTETVYGLAANAFDVSALEQIFIAKNRPKNDPLITHIGKIEDLENIVTEVNDLERQLIQHFWPGALTILFKKNEKISDLLTSHLPKVAVRMPSHLLTLELLQSLKFPLAAPSANPFGYISPTTAQHVVDQLGDKIEYVLDGGDCNLGIESTIIEVVDNQIIIRRLGSITIESLSKFAKVIYHNVSNEIIAPGMLLKHYAPKKKLIIGDIEKLIKENRDKKIGVLSFYTLYNNVSVCNVLSLKKSLGEASHNLYASLRKLDQSPVDIILTEKFPENDLGMAINDRLKKASN